jgi:uncharacterized protein (DUF2236 family)
VRRPGSTKSDDPPFRPDSLIRRVGGEPAMWLGAQRALLLQLAHPAVAAAVDDHSAFREQPHRRLWSTADTMLAMVWGDGREATAARAHVHSIHDRINGGLPDETPPWHAGAAYTAHDPVLLAWVWSTLVDTADTVFARFVGPLSPDERDRLYADWLRFAGFFGIPRPDLPSDRHAFARVYQDDVASLVVTPTARRVSRAVLDPPLWWAPSTLKSLAASVTTSLLPPALRDAYGLEWDEEHQRRADRVQIRLRRGYRPLPHARVELPRVYLFCRRLLAPSPGTRPGPIPRRSDTPSPCRDSR